MLLNAGANVNAVDGAGMTPLHHSVSAFSYEIQTSLTRLLLKNEANALAKDSYGNTPLHKIQVRSDSGPIIDLLIHYGGDMTSTRASDGKTPLHLAIEDTYGQDLLPMLKHVTDCNITDSQGNTPLHSAIDAFNEALTNDRIECKGKMIRNLLGAGADPNRRNNQGLTPVHLLARDKVSHNLADPAYKFYFELLEEKVLPDLLASGADLEGLDSNGRTILLQTVAIQSWKVGGLIPILLDSGVNPNVRDYQGDTALHLICRRGAAASLVESLVENGANVSLINNAGNTLLHEIARSNNAEQLTKLLLRKGLDPIAQNYQGQTPLHMICGMMPGPHGSNLQSMLETALARGLDLEDNNGIRPIHLAATISEQNVALLINAEADAMAITKEGRTILHAAARARQSNIIGYILDHYFSIGRLELVNSQDNDGMTALHEACRSGGLEAVKLLLSAGAKVDLKAKLGEIQGNTLLHTCASFEEEKILWSLASRQITPKRTLDAAGVLIADVNRPPVAKDFETRSFGMFDPISQTRNDTQTTRVRDIVEILIEHSAEVGTLNSSGMSPIDIAVDMGCEEMVEVLMPYVDEIYTKQADQFPNGSRFWPRRNNFAEKYLCLRGSYVGSILAEEIIVGEPNATLCAQLLALGKIEALKQLPKMGVDFTPQPGETSFL